MNSIIIKFIKAIGEIPEGALGLIRIGIYSRVFIPRRYVNLAAPIIPCYDMPEENPSSYWTHIQESALTDLEKKELSDFEEEISKKEKLFIGEDLILKTFGI
jgi:hypothetical protein